jgi:hypothetical protein
MTDLSKTPEGEALVTAIREALGERPDGAHNVGVRAYVREQPDAARAYLNALLEAEATDSISAKAYFGLPDADKEALSRRRAAAEIALKYEGKAFNDFTNALIARWAADEISEKNG